jgi:hypothetical protein
VPLALAVGTVMLATFVGMLVVIARISPDE